MAYRKKSSRSRSRFSGRRGRSFAASPKSRRRGVRSSGSRGHTLRLVIESPSPQAVTPVSLADRFVPKPGPQRPKF